MKLIFAGTPALAVPSLQALLDSAHEIVAVYTKPDQPMGRGQKLAASPVKQLALQHQLLVRQPATLRTLEAQQQLSALNADLMIVIAYGLLLPPAILSTPRLGCINVHVSLLPRWRGAAPIQRAILAGDTETGISIMQMDAGLDTGPVFAQFPLTIDAADTSGTLHDRLAQLGAEQLLSTLPAILNKTLQPQTQIETSTCYAKKIDKQEGLINWLQPAKQIHQQIRAFNPWPVAYSYLDEQLLRLWAAECTDLPSTQAPGTIVSATKHGIDVATADNLLRITQLQLAGGRCLPAAALLNARANLFRCGKKFNASATA